MSRYTEEQFRKLSAIPTQRLEVPPPDLSGPDEELSQRQTIDLPLPPDLFVPEEELSLRQTANLPPPSDRLGRAEELSLRRTIGLPPPREVAQATFSEIPGVRREVHQQKRKDRDSDLLIFLVPAALLVGILLIVLYPLLAQSLAGHQAVAPVHSITIVRPTPTPKPFDPSIGAVLPDHRIVAFYAIPNAPSTGPAYQLTATMLKNLQTQSKAYQDLDPAHPVQMGIDLVASVPDGFPGPEGNYSHHLDPDTIQSYIDFCQQNGLILFLDLNFGLAPVASEVNFFLPYLIRYPFVDMAIDPEWMFPRHDGIPGINLSNVRASDLNPIIETVAALPMKYHIPRKILLIHQYRPDGDGLKHPFDAGQAEIADKRNLVNDPRVDVVIHIDSVGGYNGDQADKTWQYNSWVGDDMQKYQNFRYGGFKLFYHIEAKTLMTPAQVLALKPSPMIVTYGN